jgi:hypothetical protein
MRKISAFTVQVRGKAYKTPDEITNRIIHLEVSKRSELVSEVLRRARKRNEASAYFDTFALVPFVKPVAPPPSAKQQYKRYKQIEGYLECLLSGNCVINIEALDLLANRLTKEISFLPANQTAGALGLLAEHSQPRFADLLATFKSKIDKNEHYRNQLDFSASLKLLEYLPCLRETFLPYIASLATFAEVSEFARTAQLLPEDIEAIKAALTRLKRQSPGEAPDRPVNLFTFSEDPTHSEMSELEEFLVLR